MLLFVNLHLMHFNNPSDILSPSPSTYIIEYVVDSVSPGVLHRICEHTNDQAQAHPGMEYHYFIRRYYRNLYVPYKYR